MLVDAQAVETAKADGGYLRSTLGVERDGNHLLCPICRKTNMRCVPKDGERCTQFRWDCFSGCGGGDIIDALVTFGKMTKGQAFQEIGKKYGGANYANGTAKRAEQNQPDAPPPEKVERYATKGDDPVLDMDAAEEFIRSAHKHLMENLELNVRFRRGLSEECIVRRRIGFIENTKLCYHGPSSGWNIPAAWVLPITDENDMLKGVKLHMEIRPKLRDGKEFQSKALWAPFGTVPGYKKSPDGTTITPRHCYDGMWPHPANLKPKTPMQDFSLEADWWIKRFQEKPGNLEDQWSLAVEAARLDIAFQKGINVEQFESADYDDAIHSAFHAMRADIQRVVMDEERFDDRPEDRRDWDEFVFVFPGELKGLACESAGHMATSSTMGEARIPGPDFLQALSGLRTAVCWDNDPPRRNPGNDKITFVGRDWGRRTGQVLQRIGAAEVVSICGGRKSK